MSAASSSSSGKKKKKYRKKSSQKSDCILVIGMYYELRDGRIGQLRYVGEVDFQTGVWYGLQLLPGFVGKNSGAVRGVDYFKCDYQLGVFVRQPRIKRRVPSKEIAEIKSTPSKSKRRRRKSVDRKQTEEDETEEVEVDVKHILQVADDVDFGAVEPKHAVAAVVKVAMDASAPMETLVDTSAAIEICAPEAEDVKEDFKEDIKEEEMADTRESDGHSEEDSPETTPEYVSAIASATDGEYDDEEEENEEEEEDDDEDGNGSVVEVGSDDDEPAFDSADEFDESEENHDAIDL